MTRVKRSMREEVRSWLRDKVDDVRWGVRRWSESHPPRNARLVVTVLTSDERQDYFASAEGRTAYDRPSEDRAVAVWLLARGEGDRVPPELLEEVKIRLDPEGPE